MARGGIDEVPAALEVPAPIRGDSGSGQLVGWPSSVPHTKRWQRLRLAVQAPALSCHGVDGTETVRRGGTPLRRHSGVEPPTNAHMMSWSCTSASVTRRPRQAGFWLPLTGRKQPSCGSAFRGDNITR